MKTKFIVLILSILFNSISYAQISKKLTKSEIEKIDFEFKQIPMPLANAYKFNDKSGTYNLFLFEDSKMISKNVSLNSKILAVCYLEDHGRFFEKWQINDFLTDNPERGLDININYLEEYCSFKDIDGDKIIDPVIVYATTNGYDEWQHIKIITIYKNKKYVIRAQECVLDYCRTFNKTAIKKLPKAIQFNLESLLQKMRVEKDLILSNG